ncbi:MAG: hypothetical protein LJE68_01085 [Rhodobacter sp.]|jgi:hypothetical protein|nr:hypothetical protein [Rhodobacter sp.]
MPDAPEPETDPQDTLANRLTLEICFLAVVALVVVAAFFEALTYQLVSSRTPFVIMVPLFVLIVIQARRLFRVRGKADFGGRVRLALAGKVPDLNKVLVMSGWMVVLLTLIVVLGHYAGILIFAFVLMRVLAKERLVLAVTVAVVTTAIIFCIFEIGFNVELYRGLVWRYFAGYRDF